MKSIRPILPVFAAAMAVSALIPSTALYAQDIDCAAVGERVAAAVKANPDQVLTVVEDALVAYKECACEVVSAAIKNSNASADTVKSIVMVAVQNAETQAPAIAECAVGAAPQHAEAVRIAFAESFNGKAAPAAPVQEQQPQPTGTPATMEAEAAPVRTEIATAAERASGEWTDGNGAVVDTVGGKAPVYGDANYADASYAMADGKAPMIDSKAPIYEPTPVTDGGAYFGAAPLTLGNAFLIPPVSASPIIQDEPEVIIKEVVKFRTRTKFVPRTVIRTVPVSPTAP